MKHVSALKPQGAFYMFVDIGKVLDMSYKGQKIGNVDTMANILLEDYKVAVIACNDFGFDDHIRLSYAISLEQIKKGLDRIEKFLEDIS